MSFEMIKNAYSAGGFNASIKYCNGILKSWSQKGYKKPSDIDEIQNGFSNDNGRKINIEDDIMLSGMNIVPDFDTED